MSGVLLVDKPPGISSAGVLRRLRGRLGRRTKLGHAGTLDPFASGLLPVCVGEATKVARFLSDASKIYEGTIALGSETDTLDPTGVVTTTAPVPAFGAAELEAVARGFTGRVEQEPPMFSALKQDGVPLYRLARQGRRVERARRVVEISSLALWPEGATRVGLRVTCSKGTYVRTLAADVGRALGTVGHLERLRRLGVGCLAIEGAGDLDALADGAAEVLPLVSIEDALAGLDRMTLSPVEAHDLRQGRQELLARLPMAGPGTAVLLLEARPGGGRGVCGVAETDAEGRWRLARVILQPEVPLHE